MVYPLIRILMFDFCCSSSPNYIYDLLLLLSCFTSFRPRSGEESSQIPPSLQQQSLDRAATQRTATNPIEAAMQTEIATTVVGKCLTHRKITCMCS